MLVEHDPREEDRTRHGARASVRLVIMRMGLLSRPTTAPAGPIVVELLDADVQDEILKLAGTA